MVYNRKRYLILGNGAAGIRAAEVIRQLDSGSHITIVSQETYPHYQTPRLLGYIVGKYGEDRVLSKTLDFYRQNQVDLLLGKEIHRVNTRRRTVLLGEGEELPYDALLIATGRRPRRLPVPGANLPGVVTLKTLDDAVLLMELLKGASEAVVIGGGLTAMELAWACRSHGLTTTMLVREDRLWAQGLDKRASQLVQETLERLGVTVRFGEEVREVLGEGRVRAVLTRRGEELRCQLVGMTVGTLPNTDFLAGTDVEVDQGVVVDEHLESRVPGIYAAGDVAQSYDLVSSTKTVRAGWHIAREMGEYAAANMAGQERPYAGGVAINIQTIFDMNFASVGILSVPWEDLEALSAEDPAKRIYRKVVLAGSHIGGGMAVRDVGFALALEKAAACRLDISAIKDRLLEEGFDLGKYVEALVA